MFRPYISDFESTAVFLIQNYSDLKEWKEEVHFVLSMQSNQVSPMVVIENNGGSKETTFDETFRKAWARVYKRVVASLAAVKDSFTSSAVPASTTG